MNNQEKSDRELFQENLDRIDELKAEKAQLPLRQHEIARELYLLSLASATIRVQSWSRRKKDMAEKIFGHPIP